MRKAETILSEVKVLLNNEGNVEVEYSNVPHDDFVKEIDWAFTESGKRQ